ncbi:MAG: D-alanyl-D-alanine carboxypeptidase/D-alanyl-D-alanine-endopeptidase [Pseudorhodobacter sp.]|nr:D-alanyl-D-alanine carboxypeptidase/D-alanyl-D-alanine-endopeptidase [Pseudorhodobacter sp.]
MISRRWVLGGLLAGAAAPVWAEAPLTSPRPQARPWSEAGAAARDLPDAGPLIAAARLGGAVGYVVAEAASGRVLEAARGDLAQPPASVAKTITALYALERLGIGHRFATRLLATGPVVGGRIAGDLVLVGSGDPTLSTDALGDMAAALAKAGVRGVRGRYLVYAGALPQIAQIDPGQPDHVGYNPAISGLNLNFNRVNFVWKRGTKGYDVSMDARAERFVPQVRMARMQVVNRAAPIYTYAAGMQGDDWTVAAAALGKDGSRWMPVRQPAVYTAEVFQTLAAAQGIRLPEAGFARSLPAGTVLVEHQSDALSVVLRDMLRFSTNMTAEILGLSCSGAATLADSGRRMSDWAAARYGLQARFVDHSGLGARSRISAADMVKALVAARGQTLPRLLRDIGIRDASGKAIKDHPVRVLAKTGTLNFVSGLAGYVVPPGGRDLVFAVFCADAARRDRLAPVDRERPPGGPEWTRRARILQGQLVNRWATLYG